MKKKKLSRIIMENIVTAVAGAFIILLGLTFIFVCLYVKNRTNDLISYRLEELYTYVISTEESDRVSDMAILQESIDECFEEDGKGFVHNPEMTEYLKDTVRDHLMYSEINVISPEGIIMASSVPGNVGFDMHSTEVSEEILKGIEESNEIYMMKDFIKSPMDGSVMKYGGARLPKYGGFVLGGQNPEEFDGAKEWYFYSRIPFSRIGNVGFFLLIDKDNEIICSPAEKYNGEKPDIHVNLEELAGSGKIAKDTVYGVSSYVGAIADGDDIIVAVYPVREAWETGNAFMVVLLVNYAIVFAIIFLLIHRLTKKHVVKGVISLDNSLSKITEGDLEEKADFRDSIEFDKLSGGINYMVDSLKGLIKEAGERIDKELAVAALIQTSFLPREFPPFPDREEFELYACMVTAKEVGGDFYDFFLIDDDHLALVVADVSGKGIPAAMFMVMAKDKLRHSVEKHGNDVAKAVSEVNNELCRENDEMMFVTVWLGVVNLTTGHVDYVNAGHEYPAICSGKEGFKLYKDVHGPYVAAFSGTKFTAGSFELAPGDILFQYTDGITEATNADEKLFREERMIEALNKDITASVEDIDAAVRSSVAEFVKDAPQFDDMTTLVFRYKG